MSPPLLRVDGEVERPAEFTFDDLASFDERAQVRDVSRFHPTRRGDGVTLNALLARVRPKPSADWLTLHASADDFSASVPLAAVRNEGIVLYRLDERPLPAEKGGPIRFLIKDPAACPTGLGDMVRDGLPAEEIFAPEEGSSTSRPWRTDELDECANVKFVDRIELTAGRGRDTRPQDEKSHAALHRRAD